MTTNPLTTLTEESTKISPDISPAKAAYMLSQLLEYVDYDELESIAPTEPINPEEQSDAIKTLASIIASLNSGMTMQESIVTAIEPFEIQQDNQKIIPELPVLLADNLAVTSIEEEPGNLNQINNDSIIVLGDEQGETEAEVYEEDIMLYVIPLILARLMSVETLSEDSEDGEIRIYQSDEFTASLQLTVTEEQILILKRKQNLYSENEVALNAFRKTNHTQFQITTNQLTQVEIEKFKMIALLEYNQSIEILYNREELGD